MAEVGSYCTQCGAKVEPASRFCSNCGETIPLVSAAPAGGAYSNDNVRKKTNKTKIVGIVVISLLVFLGVVYALVNLAKSIDSANLSRDNSSSPASRQQPQPQPQQQEPPPPPPDPLSDPPALIREVGAYMQQQGWNYPQQENHVNMTRVAEGIVISKYLEGSALVIIVVQRPDCWSGSVMGSDNVQTAKEGCNTGYFSIPCSGFFGTYSLAIQRRNEGDGLPFTIQLWKGGKLLKQAETKADYGVVSLGGGCRTVSNTVG